MESESISERVARFRAELRQIGAENRLYFQRKQHRQGQEMKHQRRQDRILEIKVELEALLKQKIA